MHTTKCLISSYNHQFAMHTLGAKRGRFTDTKFELTPRADVGRDEWRESSGCTRQSLAENAFSRFKALFGGRLAARRPDNQYVEVMVKCATLNRMTGIGMPESVRIR